MGKIAFVFPGQGAQHPGMGLNLNERILLSRFIFNQADQIRPGTSKQCFYGDEETLKQTVNTQPCLFAVEMAAKLALSMVGISPDMVAGFSLGELAALTAAESMDFATGMAMVTERGKLMQAASDKADSVMVAVLKLDPDKVEALCAGYSKIYPVNYNCPGQIVVSGDRIQMERFKTDVKSANGRTLPLKVSGAFHSPFMAEAADQFAAYLKPIHFSNSDIPVYSNYTGLPYHNNYRELLRQQIYHPVQWQTIVENMIADGADIFIEVGPGNTLSGFIKRINPDVLTCQVADWDSLEATEKAVKRHG